MILLLNPQNFCRPNIKIYLLYCKTKTRVYLNLIKNLNKKLI